MIVVPHLAGCDTGSNLKDITSGYDILIVKYARVIIQLPCNQYLRGLGAYMVIAPDTFKARIESRRTTCLLNEYSL
jgi:hypothetical protein